jgi:isoamylase
VRAYWRGDEGKLPSLASRLTASSDLFAKRGRKPWASVNFVTAHDGFTLATRLRQMRNMLATLILARGTPMLLGGDEFARSQKGNNNSYCQDNEISWVDWPGIESDGRALAEFVRKLIMLRHALPMLRRGLFLTGAYDEELGGQGCELADAGRDGDDGGELE